MSYGGSFLPSERNSPRAQKKAMSLALDQEPHNLHRRLVCSQNALKAATNISSSLHVIVVVDPEGMY